MNVLKALRFLGCGLFVLTVVSVMILPMGMLPSIVGLILALLTALDLLVLVIFTFVKDHSVRGLVQVMIYGSLLLMVGGWCGSQFLAEEVLVEIDLGETIVFDDEGHTLGLNDMKIDERTDEVSFDVVLTRPDQVSFHETIKQSKPLNIDGFEIHPMEAYSDYGIFLIQKDIFRNIMALGGILFLVSLGLFALPPVRKGGEQ